MEAFLLWLVTFVTEMTAAIAEVAANAATAAAAALTAVNAPGTNSASTSSVAIGTGGKSFTVQTGKAWVAGMFVTIAETSNPANWMAGQITAYNSGTGALTVNVTQTGGSGTIAAWTLALAPPDSITLAGKTLVDPAIDGAIKEETFAITDGSSVDIDPGNGTIQTWTLGANRTPTATNFQSGESVLLRIADGSAFAVTWTTIGVVWVDGAAPTLPATGYALVEIWKDGSTVYGAWIGNVAS